MAIKDEEQRIEKLVEKLKKLEAKKEQLDVMEREKISKDKTHLNKCYYGQYGN